MSITVCWPLCVVTTNTVVTCIPWPPPAPIVAPCELRSEVVFGPYRVPYVHVLISEDGHRFDIEVPPIIFQGGFEDG